MLIRITDVPPGEAPLEVRQQWLGLVMPTSGPTDLPLIGVLYGAPDTANHGGFVVELGDAIEALRDIGAHTAADWWQSHLRRGSQLVFGQQFCERI